MEKNEIKPSVFKVSGEISIGSKLNGGVKLIKSNKILDHAIKFMKLTSLNPDDRNTILIN